MKKLPNLWKLEFPIFTKLLILILLQLFFFSSCNQTKDKELTKSEMKHIIEKYNELLGNCFMEGNVDKLAQMYTDSAKLSPNGYEFVYGRDSIKSFWAEDFKTSKVKEMKTEVMTVDGNNEVIYETGQASSTIIINDTITYNAKVKYVNVWRLQGDGSYKLDIDFWNKAAN